jgi:hypothetical protein
MSRRPRSNPAGHARAGNSASESIERNANTGGNPDSASSGIAATNITNETAVTDEWGPLPGAVNPAEISGGHSEPVGETGQQPANTGTASTAETGRRKRGRPPGSSNKTASADITGIETLLLAVHTSLARIIPEMQLQPAEAHDLAAAYDNVALHYPALRMPAHVAALTTFSSQIALIYGPRFLAMRMRMSMGRQAPRPTPNPMQPTAERPIPQPQAQATPQYNGVDLTAKGPKNPPPEHTKNVQVAPGMTIDLPENFQP